MMEVLATLDGPGLGDKAALAAPALERAPGEVGEAPCRLAAQAGVALGPGVDGTDILNQAPVAAEPEDIVHPTVRLALGHQPLVGEARHCAQHDRHFWPTLPNTRDSDRMPSG